MKRRLVFSATLIVIFAFTGILCAQGNTDESQLQLGAYAGLAVDTFIAEEVQRYLNYDASTGTRERGIAGVDFAYRTNKPLSERWPAQLTIFGETLYGVRSTEVDCSDAGKKELPICGTYDPTKLPERALYIMRNASSVEGYAGVRFEFLGLNTGDEQASANLYVKTQMGFQSVSKGSNDVADDHLWLGLGGIVTKGDFKNSYLEFGRGRSDVFTSKPRSRWKIDGYVEFPMVNEDFWIRPFVQMYINVDGGPNSDAVQTFFGFNFDIRKLKL